MSHAHFNRHGVEVNYTKLVDQILEIMRRHPDIKIAALAKELGVSRQTIYRALAIPAAPKVPEFSTIETSELSEPVEKDETPTVPRMRAAVAQ